MSKFYIASSLPYASKLPHVGNDYEQILSDTVARWKRLGGLDVRFSTGTDEHGQKIELLAAEAGVSPKEYVDGVCAKFHEIYAALGVQPDCFIRTTDPEHERAVSRVFQRLYDKGDIYKGAYDGNYCVPCESFFTDSELVDGNCPDCGRPVRKEAQEAYFLAMSRYSGRLMDYIDSHPDFITPESRRREMVNNFIKPGLQDLCVTRSNYKWGIPVPFDPAHVMYVWPDALLNYITNLGYDPDAPDFEHQPELFRRYWPADLQVLGKDILRFHMIYWPIILMMLDLPLPERIYGHAWVLFGAEKMSKSRGNVIGSLELCRRFGADAVRFYVLATMPYGDDGNLTYELLIKKFNMDLANNLGNLVSRTAAMINKYFGGTVRRFAATGEPDADLAACADLKAAEFASAMDQLRLVDAVDAALALSDRANRFIDQTTPWALAKDEANRERLEAVLYHLAEAVRVIASLLLPVMPGSCAEILRQYGAPVPERPVLFAEGRLREGFGSRGSVTLADGAGKPVFARIDEAAVLAGIAAEQKPAEQVVPATPAPSPAPAAHKEVPSADAQIDYELFMRTDLRVARVLECEPVEKSDKLLRLQLDAGPLGRRQVVSGIARFYRPEQLIGRGIVLVANLKPAKLRGVLSEGMILASGEDEVKVVFVEGEPGDRVR